MNFLQFIKQCPPFNLLPDSELLTLKSHLRLQYFNPHTTILRQGGQPSQYIYLINKGTIHLVHHGQTINQLTPNDIFGRVSMSRQTPPEYSFVTQDPCEIFTLSHTALEPLLQKYPAFAEGFTYDLTERLRHMTEPQTAQGNLTVEVEKLITRSPIIISPETSVSEAARLMRDLKIGAVLVNTDPMGLVTEQDFKNRVLAEGLGPDTLIEQVMTQPIKTLSGDTPVYAAMLYMLEQDIRRLPLTRQGQVIGMVSVTDLLRYQTINPFFVLNQLEKDPAGLTQYAHQATKIVTNLYDGGLDIIQIGRTIASMNDNLIKRLLLLAEGELGPPPTPYCWLVFGSEGRMEQLFLTDQDNALVYQDDTPEAALYFQNLTEKVVQYLMQAGFPPCPGGYMATNWHKPLAQWEALFQEWIEEPNSQALLESSIFFDFRPVHGELSVDSLRTLIRETQHHSLFLAHLARAALQFFPPLGFFGRILKDDQGRIDIKKSGVACIVGMARVYGLSAGVESASTLERLEEAWHSHTLSQNGAELLIETFRFLLHLRLKEQLLAYANGRIPDNYIKWDDLSPLNQRHLKDAFAAISEHQKHLASQFHTDRLG